MLSFAIAVFLLIVTPGPGVLSTAGVGLGFLTGHGRVVERQNYDRCEAHRSFHLSKP